MYWNKYFACKILVQSISSINQTVCVSAFFMVGRMAILNALMGHTADCLTACSHERFIESGI